MNTKRFNGLCLLVMLIVAITVSSAQANPQEKTYTVDSNGSAGDANPGDGVCDTGTGQCSLVAAIQEANQDGDSTTIRFAYYFQSPVNHFDGCALPAITANNTTIDASNKWNQADNRPGVDIIGAGCEHLVINASHTTVLGIFMGGSGATGVHIYGGNNTIGGSGAGQRNVFLTDKYGVWIQGSSNNTVHYNYFGTITGETTWASAGQRGIFIQANDNNVANNNLIAGQGEGIMIWGSNNLVQDNIIGLNPAKTKDLPNLIGIRLYQADGNVIGPGNYIGGNSSHGVELYHADNNVVTENHIGNPGTSSSHGNGGHGVFVNITLNNTVEKNIIYGNTGHGIYVYASGGHILKGNGIAFSGQDGVFVENSSNGAIGGSGNQENNFITSNTGNGIHLSGSNNNTIVANFVGRDDWSTYGICDYPNQGHGILIDNGSSGNAVGGEPAAERNHIAYNGLDGIRISGSATNNNAVLNNLLGAPDDWCVQPRYGHHGIAIYDGAHNNQIGGLSAGNTVLGAGWSGVVIVNSSDNTVIANRIGTDGSISNAGNGYYGVNIVGNGYGNYVTFDEIAYNGTVNGMDGNEAGIQVDGSWANLLSQNSIHDNDGPGIELVNNGNTNTPAPSINQASCEGPVSGTAGGPGWVIEIFSDNSNEGRTYEGQATVDPGGNWSWGGKPKGANVTATARAQSNDTSPFSAPFPIGVCVSLKVFLPVTIR